MKKILLLALAASLYMGSAIQAQEKKLKYEANWESIKQYEIPEWFANAKFGIFIHWGPYAVPAYKTEWYPRLMYQDSVKWHQTDPAKTRPGASDCYKHHVETYGHPGEFGYKDFIPLFKAENFDAKQWIDLFKEAGARYVVPVAEHHDGFAMYKSNVSKWNAVEMGPKRDVVGEIKKAAKDAGMYFGVSSHFAFNWDYYYHKPGFDTYDPEYIDLYGPIHPTYDSVSDEFLQTWWDRTADIVDNYQPDILWFDFYIDRNEFRPYHPQIAAYYYNKGEEWGKEVVLQTKNMNFKSFPDGANVLDIERGKLADIRKYPWQTDTSVGLGSWCYTEQWRSKTAKTLIDDLIDIVSKNGTMLLNVGPKADGTIPADQTQVLLDMGAWLKVNGEAIYDTKPWKIFGEGPTEVHSGHHTEAKNESFTSDDFRFTTKVNVIYVTALAKAENGKYTIESLSTVSKLLDQKVRKVSLLGSDEKIEWEQTNKALNIKVEKDIDTEFARVFKVTLK